MNGASSLIAVVDVETTGLFSNRGDRVIEIAAVVMRPDGHIEREFVTLVNPMRDIGPTRIHGLCSEEIINAPRFDEIAAAFLNTIRGCVAIAGHNVSFDRRFLESEFDRIGYPLPDVVSLCTMRMSGGGKLFNCCRDHDVCVDDDAHHALADARACARLLTKLITDEPETMELLAVMKPIRWPDLPMTDSVPVTRDSSQLRLSKPPSFLRRLFERIDGTTLDLAADDAMMTYLALLDRSLEDRMIEECEVDALIECAEMLGLSGEQVRAAHRGYLDQLVIAALADGVVTDAERRDLCCVGRLLGVCDSELAQMLSRPRPDGGSCQVAAVGGGLGESIRAGIRVCFTGETLCCHRGRMITREFAQELATGAGLVVTESVTKKIDLLVVADPHTQSGKARKAKSYGIRIMHEAVFWRSLGVEVE